MVEEAAVNGLSWAIRAWFATRLEIMPCDDDIEAHESLQMAAHAVTAVLDRHKPGYPDGVEYEHREETTYFADGTIAGYETVKGDQMPGYYCEECREFSPCPTVRDIAEKLGVEVDGG